MDRAPVPNLKPGLIAIYAAEAVKAICGTHDLSPDKFRAGFPGRN
jgi:hypothetical protein